LKPLFSRAVRTVAWNAVIPDRERRDGGPELVIRGEHAVILLTAVENGGAGRSKMVALGGVDLP